MKYILHDDIQDIYGRDATADKLGKELVIHIGLNRNAVGGDRYTTDSKCYLYAKELLDKGANPDMCDNMGNTALHTACMYNAPELVKLLLKYGSDVNSVNKYNLTPLYKACQISDNLDVVTLLLKQGANPNIICNVSGKTGIYPSPLWVACFTAESIPIMDILIKYDANISLKYGKMNLYQYIVNGDYNCNGRFNKILAYLSAKGLSK